MHVYVPPIGPGQIYSQGFWHAVLAAILYLLGAALLAINLTGYLRGHFPQQFILDHTQRTLILQTMGFFFWLAGGAGIFCAIEGITFANALYYADVVRSSCTTDLRTGHPHRRIAQRRLPNDCPKATAQRRLSRGYYPEAVTQRRSPNLATLARGISPLGSW